MNCKPGDLAILCEAVQETKGKDLFDACGMLGESEVLFSDGSKGKDYVWETDTYVRDWGGFYKKEAFDKTSAQSATTATTHKTKHCNGWMCRARLKHDRPANLHRPHAMGCFCRAA